MTLSAGLLVAAARRSIIDAFLPIFASDNNLQLSTAYWDYQAHLALAELEAENGSSPSAPKPEVA